MDRRRMHGQRLLDVAALLAATLAATLVNGCGQEAPRRSGPQPPRIEVVDLAGLKQALAKTGAPATLVNFWATWCGPCVAELDDLLAAARPHRDDGSLVVVLVSYDLRTPATTLTPQTVVPMIREFAASHAIDCTVLIYDDAILALAEAFGLAGPLPSTILLGDDGQVVSRHEGSATRDEFEAMIAGALAAAAGSQRRIK